jgi:hypothetical protein
MSVGAVNNTATRSTIIQYAQVLVDIDQLIAQYQQQDNDSSDTTGDVTKAHTLASLITVLRDMSSTGLANTDSLKDLVAKVIQRAQPVLNALNSKSPSQISDALAQFASSDINVSGKTAVDSALSPTNWGNINIQDAISDVAFYEYYRKADANTAATIGTLGNRIQVSEQFLKAMNNIYQGSTWNPGSEFISTNSQLQDYRDDAGQDHFWYEKFVKDQVSMNMSEGVAQLQTMKDSGLFPVGSIEQTTTDYILSKWNSSYSQGGFQSAANADSANRMWTDREFKKMLQNGIDGSSRISEQNQLSVSQLLSNYDFFTRSSANFVARENDSVVGSARGIKPQ